MIVHIATDEKFINAANFIYENAFPGENLFLILDSLDKQLRHVKKESNVKLLPSNNFLKSINSYINDESIIIFHGFSEKHAIISNNYLKNKQVWSVFGKEFYENPFIKQRSIYGLETSRVFLGIKHKLKKVVRPFYYLFFARKTDPFKQIVTAFRNIDYISVLYEEEFLKIKESGLFKDTVEFVKFTYYPLDIIIKEENLESNAEGILIGNSATPSNNHLEVFNLLKKTKGRQKKLVVPISYGDPKYAEKLIEKSRKFDFENINFLQTFLSLEEYQTVLKRCSIVIMNHYRQQAVGNVLNSVALGAKVFLSNKSTLFTYLKRIGCNIYSVEDDLVNNGENQFNRLNQNEITTNKTMLNQELSIKNIVFHLQDNFQKYLKNDVK